MNTDPWTISTHLWNTVSNLVEKISEARGANPCANDAANTAYIQIMLAAVRRSRDTGEFIAYLDESVTIDCDGIFGREMNEHVIALRDMRLPNYHINIDAGIDLIRFRDIEEMMIFISEWENKIKLFLP